jgi:hypothetical protein
LTLVLFLFFLYEGNKLSDNFGGILYIVSGSCLFYLNYQIGLSEIYVISVLSVLAIMLYFLGVYKLFIKEIEDENGNKRKVLVIYRNRRKK